MPTPFRRALAFTLAYEGGYVDHPSDPGGATNRGVTQGTYDAWRASHALPKRSVRLIEQSEVESIYHRWYWLPTGAAELREPVGLVVFDAAVNSGVNRALAWYSMAGGDWREMLALRLEFMTDLTIWGSFGRGWARRISALLSTASALEAEDEPAERLVVLMNAGGEQVGVVPYTHDDVLVRVTRSRVFVRPD